MARTSREATAASPDVRPISYPELGLCFSRAAVLIPRLAPGEHESVTYASAALARTQRPSSLELRTPPKSAATALQRIGLSSLREVQTRKTTAHPEGAYARLESLGVTLAFFGGDSVYSNAINELAGEFEFIPDFPMWLPPRASLGTVPTMQGLSAPFKTEWPDSCGVSLAWERSIRGSNVLIGVLDTGIDADHPEFSGKLVTYRYVSFFPNSPYWPPRDVRGFDMGGHGTHVCGIIAGKNVGIAPEVSLYVASVIESETTRTTFIRVTYGLNWLLQQFSRPENQDKPAVINMSLGIETSPPPEMDHGEFELRIKGLQLLMRTLAEANVLTVAAVGNDGPGKIGYPGAFEEVVGVGAVDFERKIASFSGSAQPGKLAKPDLVGYGVDVYSSVERDYSGHAIYKRFSGTSMAAPYVTGIASLYWCQDSNMSVRAIQQRLLDNCETLSGQPKDRIGKGLARFKLS